MEHQAKKSVVLKAGGSGIRTMDKKFPARVHVVLARESRVGIVFRRGPSKKVGVFLWDRTTDSLRLGQWLHGRIYERRADISPDGQWLIYFAMNGKWDSETRGAWTAISQVPWLKALNLYAKGNCWEGGGLFLSNQSFWINDRCFSPKDTLFESSPLLHDKAYQSTENWGTGDAGVYYPRLMRDGWRLVKCHTVAPNHSTCVFEKTVNAHWVLTKITHEQLDAPLGKGCYWDEHALHAIGGKEMTFPLWEWADVDGGDLVWAMNGCLYRASVDQSQALVNTRLLHDFNLEQFQHIEAPY